jgi:hypothetical protein
LQDDVIEHAVSVSYAVVVGIDEHFAILLGRLRDEVGLEVSMVSLVSIRIGTMASVSVHYEEQVFGGILQYALYFWQ